MNIVTIELKGTPCQISKHIGSILINAGFPYGLEDLSKEKRIISISFIKMENGKTELKIMYEGETNEEILGK